MVTPPVALAAYAAAAIAKADVMKAAFSAFRFALVGFALPFAFVLKPELLMLTIDNEAASPLMVVIMVSITLIGILGLAASIAGYAFQAMSSASRSVLLGLSLLVFFTRWQEWQITIQLVAVAMIIVLMAINYSLARSNRL